MIASSKIFIEQILYETCIKTFEDQNIGSWTSSLTSTSKDRFVKNLEDRLKTEEEKNKLFGMKKIILSQRL